MERPQIQLGSFLVFGPLENKSKLPDRHARCIGGGVRPWCDARHSRKSRHVPKVFGFMRGSNPVSEVSKMSVPLKATSYHTTEHLLELALTMLENARREQNTDQLPSNNWLTNNFTLEIIRAKVAANKANGIINI